MDLAAYGLDFFHCETCNDTGQLHRVDEYGELWSRDCDCMARRRALRRLKRSGLDGLIRRYTFDTYQTPDEVTAALKQIAMQYCKARPAWLYISGKPGSGKTHICTAVCGEFLRNGETVLYIVWPDEVGNLKTMKAGDPPDPEYSAELERLKTFPVLYIDDFAKGKQTAADMKIAFEILNARYNNPKLRTIISSEMDPKQIGDKAVSGRIIERARGYILESPRRDWRQ